MRPLLLSARSILPHPGELLDGGGLLIRGGRILALLRNAGEVRRATSKSDALRIDLGEALLAPGLVNAHAHLELGCLAGRLTGERGMVCWIGSLLRERARLGPGDHHAAVRAGSKRLIETGTTTVGDVDSTGAASQVLPGTALRARVYREVLDAGDQARTEASFTQLEDPLPEHEKLLEGISPHAPHTVSRELMQRCAALARRRGLPLTVHWAETPEENEWLREGGGPFAGLLGPSPRRSGLALLEDSGLLDLSISLVHANCPEAGDLDRLVGRGAVLVHCPGTHAFFGREQAPLEGWEKRGLPIALGTDSLASNADLDLRREMALVRAAHPGLRPESVFDWATRGGARAVGFPGEVGELCPGAWADLCGFDVSGGDRKAVLEELTGGEPRVTEVLISGERCFPGHRP